METNITASNSSTFSPSAYRHYCCVCSNYRGKIIDNVPVKLHRFPANKTLQTLWIKRIKLVSPKFQFNQKNDRLCSTHFQQGKYIKGSKDASIPSIFKLENGNEKRFAATMDQNTCMSIMNDETQQIEDQDMDFELMEVTEQESLCTSDLSNEQTSALLHDYCGIVKSSSVSKYLDKCEQTSTCTTERVDQGTQTCGDNICMKPIMVSTSTQTESSGNITEEKVNVSVGIKTLRPDLTFEDIQHSEELCMFYTGLPNAATFYMLFDELNDVEEHTKRSGIVENQGRPRILRLIDEFFLVLMRLRLGLLLQDLAQRFHVSKSTCSNITNYWITYLSVKLSSLTPWIDKKTITETMPRKFQKKYPNCRVIIDCTEIYTETPQSLANKSLMYSNYKSHMTYKALLGISPSGVITFSSDLWAGSVSDKQLTLKSGLLDLCEPGDAIMADKGFLISDLTTPREIKLIIPPLKHQRFNRRQVEETRRIANLRIDVERAMERVKNFRILQGVVPITLSHQVSQIWKVCVSLSNLLPPLVHDD